MPRNGIAESYGNSMSTFLKKHQLFFQGFPQWLGGKESTCNAGDTEDIGMISEVGKIPLEEEMASRSIILARENSMDRGFWRLTIHRIAKSWT